MKTKIKNFEEFVNESKAEQDIKKFKTLKVEGPKAHTAYKNAIKKLESLGWKKLDFKHKTSPNDSVANTIKYKKDDYVTELYMHYGSYKDWFELKCNKELPVSMMKGINEKEYKSSLTYYNDLDKEEKDLYNKCKSIPTQTLLSWSGFKSEKEFEDSTDTDFTRAALIVSNYEDIKFNVDEKNESYPRYEHQPNEEQIVKDVFAALKDDPEWEDKLDNEILKYIKDPDDIQPILDRVYDEFEKHGQKIK